MKYPENTNEYQIILLDVYRERKIFSFFPFILVNNFFVWTGKWFKKVDIIERKIKERYLDFDDGWTYKNFWSEWKDNWTFEKLKN